MSDLVRNAKKGDSFNAADLDAGIRAVVLWLRAGGFDTTDSGDGVSKPAASYASGEALPFPHVVARLGRGADLVWEARDMRRLLVDRPESPVYLQDWHVEASYSTRDGVVLLFARGPAPSSAPAGGVGVDVAREEG